jgi:hypothetical protein
MLHKILCTLVILTWFYSTAVSQDTLSGSPTIRSNLQAPKYKILLTTNKSLAARSLDSLKGNTLYVSGKNGPQEVSTMMIKRLSIAKGKKQALKGLGLGALSGAGTGALLGLAAYQKPDPNSGSWSLDFGPGFSALGGSILGLVGGSLVGVIIGSSSYKYTHYDFSTIPPAEKSALMSRILLGNK